MNNFKQKMLFIIPSLLGVILFMIPIHHQGNWTVIVKIIADILSAKIGSFLPLLCLVILTISGLLSLWTLAKPKWIKNPLLAETFVTTPFWTFVRVLGAIFLLD